MSKVNLSGFCEVQKDVWERYTAQIKDAECKKCQKKELIMVSKWRADCKDCKTTHTIKKPKSFPKNMDDTNNWGATCDECGGKMKFHKGGSFGAYICGRCSNVMEV
jgi:RNase P subunit RPR2